MPPNPSIPAKTLTEFIAYGPFPLYYFNNTGEEPCAI